MMCSTGGDLVSRLIAGDKTAEAELVDQYYAGVCCILRNRMRNWDVLDVAQDVFTVALTQLRRGDLRVPEALTQYLRKIAVHMSTEWIKERGRSRVREGDLEQARGALAASRSSEPFAVVERAQMRAIMTQVMSNMQPVERELLRRFYVEEQPRATICSDLQISEGAFRNAKHRAKSRFAALVRKRTHLQDRCNVVKIDDRAQDAVGC